MGLINGKGASLVRQRCTVGRVVRALSKGRGSMRVRSNLKVMRRSNLKVMRRRSKRVGCFVMCTYGDLVNKGF